MRQLKQSALPCLRVLGYILYLEREGSDFSGKLKYHQARYKTQLLSGAHLLRVIYRHRGNIRMNTLTRVMSDYRFHRRAVVRGIFPENSYVQRSTWMSRLRLRYAPAGRDRKGESRRDSAPRRSGEFDLIFACSRSARGAARPAPGESACSSSSLAYVLLLLLCSLARYLSSGCVTR